MEKWPDRFTYVCNATRASLVNILPIVHAGIDRIEDLVIFCGAPSDEIRDGTLQSEAIDPAQRLRRVVGAWSGGRLSGGKVSILFGDPADIACWRTHMAAVGERTSTQGTPILFNIKGGTKEMALGGVLGGGGRQLQLVTIRGAPLGVEAVFPDRQSLLVGGAQLSLAQYLDAYDLLEQDPPRRELSESTYLANADRIARFAQTVLPRNAGGVNKIRQIASAISKITEPLYPRANSGRPVFTSGLIDPRAAPVGRSAKESLADALAILDGFLGCKAEFDGPGNLERLRVENEQAANFIRGVWLEGYLYNRLRQEFSGNKRVEIAANLGLAHRDVDGRGGPRIAELDIVLLVDSQLHIVEAKTASLTAKGARDGGEKSLAQIDSVKRLLVGQVGKVLICNPRDDWASVGKQGGDIDARARRGGEELFLGHEAVDGLIQRLRDIVRSS